MNRKIAKFYGGTPSKLTNMQLIVIYFFIAKIEEKKNPGKTPIQRIYITQKYFCIYYIYLEGLQSNI